jgi:CHAD domain-containing protein
MSSVGTLVRQRLADQRDALRVAETAARGGGSSGVHDLRVAMRRIRSVLATFRPVFDTSVTEPLRAELKAASVRLGQSRDAEVTTEITDRLLDDLTLAGPDEDAAGAGLRARLHLDATAAGDVVDETLDSTAYAALIILLDEVVTHPPFTDEALRDAGPVARQRVRHEARRFARLAAAARDGSDGDVRGATGDHGSPPHDDADHAARLHEVRKAAKRLRYAAETARPVADERMGRIVTLSKAVQMALGEHHDAVMTRATLRHLALDEAVGEAAAFLLGHLDADEQRAMATLEKRAWHAIDDLQEEIDAII